LGLSPGGRIGVYVITAQIGEGGMGRVYLARDTRLNRDVALKVLPDAFASDTDRLARFTREAQTLASLNHPNIAHIHGLEESGGVTALVMELVDGEDLSQRIARGAIPLEEALPIARQIAEALEAAHERAIVHRDLKPANIKIRPDGVVKVLDFGLAKALEPNSALRASAGQALSQSPTITTPAMTQAGMILGTAAYMSPEQARGKVVDKRADIWAFGCVLYEMLAGRRVFDGNEVSDTLAYVLTKDPDWSALPAGTPASIRRLLRRCLVKDRSNRLPDIGGARLDIDEACTEASLSSVDTRAGEPRGARTRRTAVWATGAVAAVALVALGALGAWIAMRALPADRSVARVLIGVEPADRLLSGFQLDRSRGGRPSRTTMAFSPDGRSLVFSAEREGHVQLYLRRLDQLEASPIAGTEGASNPFFAPDGQSIGFHADGALKKIPMAGGPVVVLCSVDLLFGASWSRTNQIVFARQAGGLWQVPAAGGTPIAATQLQKDSGEFSHRLPQVLPDGQTVLFTVTRARFPAWDDTQIVVQSLTTGQRKVLVEGGADARFVAPGHLVYLRRGTLMAVPFDPQRLEVTTAAAVGVVGDVMQAAGTQPVQIDTGAGQFAVSESGALVYVTGGVFPKARWSLVWVDRMGRSETLRLPAGAYHGPRLSPDGKRVAFHSTTDDWDLWTYDIALGRETRLRMEGDQSVPLWTPDGSHLVFSSVLKGVSSVQSISADGSGSALTLATRTSKDKGYPSAWTPDGSMLLTFFANGPFQMIARDGKAEPRSLAIPEIEQPDFSPDGRWLAYATRQKVDARGQVYVQRYPELDRRVQVSGESASAPAWRRDGRELYYVEDASNGPLKIRMMAVPITTTPTFSAGAPRMLFEGAFRIDGPFRTWDVTPDGQRFLMVQEVAQPAARLSQMVLVQNWFEELKRVAPAK
jgi:Tol biopolymer transport system component